MGVARPFGLPPVRREIISRLMTRVNSIQKCTAALAHMTRCKKLKCSSILCRKMSRIYRHTKQCNLKTKGGCITCKMLKGVCCYHAMQCKHNKCFMLVCTNLKSAASSDKLGEAVLDSPLKLTISLADPPMKPTNKMELNLGTDGQLAIEKERIRNVNTVKLVHGAYCTDEDCNYTFCLQVKKFIQHSKACRKFVTLSCVICKKWMALCCYHAIRCQQTKCLVPFCSHLKYVFTVTQPKRPNLEKPAINHSTEESPTNTVYLPNESIFGNKG